MSLEKYKVQTIENPNISSKYAIISRNAKIHIPGMGTVSLRDIKMSQADRIFKITKGVLAEKKASKPAPKVQKEAPSKDTSE